MSLRGERPDRPTYSILRSIHGGAAGELNECSHAILGELCVQKTISTIGLEDAAAYNEPRILNRIHHDHVVPVREAQFDPDQDHAITFVMPKYEGGCLEDALIDGYNFSLWQAIGLTRDLLDALAYVHANLRYIHRDVKPGNVFTHADRIAACLGDFGSAAEMDESGSAPAVEGTLLYMPPEGGGPTGRLDARSDLYQAGLMLAELTNGRFPYEVMDGLLLESRLTSGQRPFRDRDLPAVPHVPSRLRRAINKSIATDPVSRFQTAGDFIRVLDQLEAEMIDWRLLGGDGLSVGEWEGAWPRRVPAAERRRYRVELTVARRGLRLVALQAVGGGPWRRFGVEDEVDAGGDQATARRFFESVAARVDHLMPARR